MRLLLVVPSYYPDVYGGAERQATILAEAARRLGVKITLLAPTLKRDLPADATTSFGVVHRVLLKALPARGGRYLLSTVAWTWRTARWIFANRARFDLVYVFHGRLHVAGPLFGARAAGLPLFVKPGGGAADSDYKALWRKKYVYGHVVAALKTRWTTGFIANSSEIAEDLVSAGVPGKRVHRLSNGVELPSPERLAAGRAARDGTRFICTSRLTRYKNVHLLIEAVALTPGARLTVVGDGEEADNLRARATALGVADRVSFLGAQKDVVRHVLTHDAYLAASLKEGQSNSLLEAFACGVIPVCAGASGVADMIADGRTGFIAPEATSEAFAAIMARIMAMSPEARAEMSQAVHRQAERDFAIDSIAAQLVDIFSAARPA